MLFGDAEGPPQIIVEVAFETEDPNNPASSTGFKLGTSLLGTGQLDSAEIWTDISDWVSAISIKRGKDEREDFTQAARCSITVDNRDGEFDPTNPSSPFGGGAGIRPMRQIRIRAILTDESEYYLFRGTIEEFDFDFDEVPVVRMECSDFIARLATQRLATIATSFSGDTTGGRITRVLQAISLASTQYEIDTGKSTMPATEYGTSVLEQCQRAEECESGFLYVKSNGVIKFIDRHAEWTYSYATTDQITLTDDGTGDMDYSSLDIRYGVSQVYNEVKVKRIDYADPPVAVEQTASSTDSIAIHATRSMSKTDVHVTDDNQALYLAQFLLARFEWPEIRIIGVNLDVLAAPDAAWPLLLGLDLMYRIGVTRNYPGNTFTRSLNVIGITHEISSGASPQWKMILTTSDPVAGSGFILGTHDLGDNHVALVY